jgi:cholesterol oxidase
MSEGIIFDESMKGPFALGAQTPDDGFAKGEAASTNLAMHASVSAPDLDAFIDDSRHEDGLSGTIDCAPIGMGLPSTGGVFNLFLPGDDPRLKLMVYELALNADGRELYVAGHKEVRDDHGFDMWSILQRSTRPCMRNPTRAVRSSVQAF